MRATRAVQTLLDAITAKSHLIIGRATSEIARRFDLTDEQVEEVLSSHAGVHRSQSRLWGYLPGEDAYRIPQITQEKSGGVAVVEKVEEVAVVSKKAQKLAKQVFEKFPKEAQKAPCKASPEQEKPFDLTRFLK